MRLNPKSDAQFTEDQRAVLQEAATGRRGHAPKPMLGWLSSPELARRAQRLGEYVRYETTLPPILSELAILVTARHWSSAYEWQAHKREALKAGLDPLAIADIAARRTPSFADGRAGLIFDFTSTLLATYRVPGPLFEAASDAFGERGVAELLGLLGYYSLVAMTLNTFEFDLPDGQVAEISHDD